MIFEHIFDSNETLTLNLLNDSFQSIMFLVSDLTSEDLQAFAPEIISLLFQMYKSEIDSKNAKASFKIMNTADKKEKEKRIKSLI